MNSVTETNPDIQLYLKRGKRLAKHVWSHFQEDRCFEEAASLGYTSLLAMVPLLAVAFGIIAAFPVFNEWSQALQDFIFDIFMPATGEQIVPYLTTFLESVSGLTLPATLILIVTALMLLVRIEVAFNRIWRVDRNRTLVNRVVMYWALLTLGPLLIAAAVALSAQKIFGASGFMTGMPPGIQKIGTFIIAWMMFSLFFGLVPNRTVRIKHALAGALLSAVLFEIAKAGFVAYVSNANYKVIYGALATVPIFLFWLYLVWIVVLFGASLAASLTTFSDYSRYESKWPQRWEFQLAYRLIGHLWNAQKEGASRSREELMELETQASELQIVRLMTRLKKKNVVTRNEDGSWMLARDLGEMSLGDLYSMGDYYLPFAEIRDLPADSQRDRAYVSALERINKGSKNVWDQSLKGLLVEQKMETQTS